MKFGTVFKFYSQLCEIDLRKMDAHSLINFPGEIPFSIFHRMLNLIPNWSCGITPFGIQICSIRMGLIFHIEVKKSQKTIV